MFTPRPMPMHVMRVVTAAVGNPKPRPPKGRPPGNGALGAPTGPIAGNAVKVPGRKKSGYRSL